MYQTHVDRTLYPNNHSGCQAYYGVTDCDPRACHGEERITMTCTLRHLTSNMQPYCVVFRDQHGLACIKHTFGWRPVLYEMVE